MLFGAPGSGGLDLISLNIQRGRDHGLPSYNDMREVMGFPRLTSFNQVSRDEQLNQSLQNAYGEVDNIDLRVGAMSETPLRRKNSQLGELFTAIIAKQFSDLRDGDRFWYENILNNSELREVRSTRLSDSIRANTMIGNELQQDVFYVR